MEIKKLKIKDEKIIKECDIMLKKFLYSENKYDDNVSIKEEVKSFAKDVACEDKMLYACTEDGKAVGFLYGYLDKNVRNKENIANLTFIYIEENYRRKGIASMLITRYVEDMKNENIKIFEVRSFANNIAAQKLYQKFGFSPLWVNYRKKL